MRRNRDRPRQIDDACEFPGRHADSSQVGCENQSFVEHASNAVDHSFRIRTKVLHMRRSRPPRVFRKEFCCFSAAAVSAAPVIAKPEFEMYLVVTYLPIHDVSAGFSQLEPVEIAQGPLRRRDCIVDRILDRLAGRSDDLRDGVNIIAHLSLSRFQIFKDDHAGFFAFLWRTTRLGPLIGCGGNACAEDASGDRTWPSLSSR